MKAYFAISNRLGVIHECDRQMDGRTNSLVANAAPGAEKNELHVCLL